MPIRHFVFTFHMPLFFLVSGYLYKNRSAKDTLKKDFSRLGVPYLVTCLAVLLYYLLYYLITKSHNAEPLREYAFASIWGSGTQHSCLLFADFPSIGAIWFLPALLVCKNVYNLLPKKNRLLNSSVLFLIATIIGRYLIYLPFSILSGLSAIIFYAIGDRLKTIKKINPPFWIIGLMCWAISFKFSHVYLVQPQLDLYFIDVIGATTASILVYLLAKRISCIPFLMQPFSWLGKNSLFILCFHLFDLNCGISSRLNVTHSEVMIIILLISFPILGSFILDRLLQMKCKPS